MSDTSMGNCPQQPNDNLSRVLPRSEIVRYELLRRVLLDPLSPLEGVDFAWFGGENVFTSNRRKIEN